MTGASASASRARVARIVRWGLLGLVAVLALSACAAGANPSVDVPASDGDVAGFWTGLWHGLIVPVTFIVSLFSDTVNVYEIHNGGNWYDFGFLLGVMTSLGGSGAGTCRARR